MGPSRSGSPQPAGMPTNPGNPVCSSWHFRGPAGASLCTRLPSHSIPIRYTIAETVAELLPSRIAARGCRPSQLIDRQVHFSGGRKIADCLKRNGVASDVGGLSETTLPGVTG